MGINWIGCISKENEALKCLTIMGLDNKSIIFKICKSSVERKQIPQFHDKESKSVIRSLVDQ